MSSQFLLKLAGSVNLHKAAGLFTDLMIRYLRIHRIIRALQVLNLFLFVQGGMASSTPINLKIFIPLKL